MSTWNASFMGSLLRDKSHHFRSTPGKSQGICSHRQRKSLLSNLTGGFSLNSFLNSPPVCVTLVLHIPNTTCITQFQDIAPLGCNDDVYSPAKCLRPEVINTDSETASQRSAV